MEKQQTKKDQGKVLEIVELFNATPEREFQAWTNRKDFVAWYGPEGFTVPFCEMDVRVGGAWRGWRVAGDRCYDRVQQGGE